MCPSSSDIRQQARILSSKKDLSNIVWHWIDGGTKKHAKGTTKVAMENVARERSISQL